MAGTITAQQVIDQQRQQREREQLARDVTLQVLSAYADWDDMQAAERARQQRIRRIRRIIWSATAIAVGVLLLGFARMWTSLVTLDEVGWWAPTALAASILGVLVSWSVVCWGDAPETDATYLLVWDATVTHGPDFVKQLADETDDVPSLLDAIRIADDLTV